MGNNLHDRININHVSVFLRIAQSNSLTEAANFLNLDKGRLSRVLQELENDLGVTLVHRTTREFRLTAEGEKFYSRCHRIFNDLEEVIFDLDKKDQEPEGRIILTAAHGAASAFLPDIISRYHELFPKVKIEVYFSQDSLNIDHENVDLAIRLGKLKDSSLKIRKLGDFEMNFFASSKFYDSVSHLKSIQDVCNYPCFILSNIEGKDVVFKYGKQRKKVSLKGAITANSPDFVRDVTLKSKGIGLLPRFLCSQQLINGDLKLLIPKWKTDSIDMHLVSPSGRKPLPNVKHFSDFLFNYTKNLTIY